MLCPSCQNTNFEDVYNSKDYEPNNPEIFIHVCHNCGIVFANIECSNCSTITVKQIAQTTVTNEYIVSLLCDCCGTHDIRHIPCNDIDMDIIEEARNNCDKSLRNSFNPYSLQLTAPMASPMSVPKRKQPPNPIHLQNPQQQTTNGGVITKMDPFYIQNCNIDLSFTDFIEECDAKFTKSGYVNTPNRTKTGKEVLVITPKSGGKLIVFTDPVTRKVSIKPHTFATHYWIQASLSLIQLISDIAQHHKGSMEYYTNQDGPMIIINGNIETGEFYITKKGTIPNLQTLELDEEPDFRVIKSIKEYLQENPPIHNEIKALAFPDNINRLGQLLISEKQNGNITFDIFKNLLIQVISIGATDQRVKNMYAFIT